MSGICVAVKATTSWVGSSRKTTLKSWKSRPAAPRTTTRVRVVLVVLMALSPGRVTDVADHPPWVVPGAILVTGAPPTGSAVGRSRGERHGRTQRSRVRGAAAPRFDDARAHLP